MVDYSLMNKDELRDYAKKEFGVNLDMRKSIETLKSEMSKYTKTEVKEEVVIVPKSTHLKNVSTGLWWPWSKLLDDRGDLVPCDENGNVNA